ncbi:uncharacterized protein [Antedon mediterranea]|uniref:uncharacterized protein n=1 Tax=Antedon mediterranea TaxID=105859 RepID=UPI003AF984DB
MDRHQYCVFIFVLLFYSIESRFSWRYCNGRQTSDVVSIDSLNISPKPIRLPGTINIEFYTQLHGNLTGPLSVKADIWRVKKRRFTTMRTKIPGCCNYNNLCAEMSTHDECPSYLTSNNIPCTCPPTPGSFNTSVTPVTFTVAEIPLYVAMFATGNFEARIKLRDGPNKRLLLCVEVDVKILAGAQG